MSEQFNLFNLLNWFFSVLFIESDLSRLNSELKPSFGYFKKQQKWILIKKNFPNPCITVYSWISRITLRGSVYIFCLRYLVLN